jgi:hypothetical protein
MARTRSRATSPRDWLLGNLLAHRVLGLGMRYLILPLSALLFAVPAKADKFWLSDPAAEKNTPAGSSPNIIEGVLVAESDEGYHVRVVGGEILLPKTSVFRIEKDDLSLDAIVAAEQESQAAGERANEERRLAQAAEQRERELRAVEASLTRSDVRAREASVTLAPRVGFDPVLGVATEGNMMPQGELIRDVQLAYTLTKDRRYLKVLRQLRRLR